MKKNIYKCDSRKRGGPIDRPVELDENDWEEMDQSDAIGSWLASGELAAFLDAQNALQSAGYRIRTAQMVKTHSIWVFDLYQYTAPRFSDPDKLLRFLRDAFWRTAIYYREDDTLVQSVGRNRLVFSIIWDHPAREPRRAAAWEREQRRLRELLRLLP